MLRTFVLGITLCGALVPPLASAQQAPTLDHVIATDSIQFVRAFSPDSQVCTLIFDNFVLGTEVGQGVLPSVSTKPFSYVLQPKSDSDVKVVQHVRGYVSTQISGSAALVIHANGKTTTVDFATAIEAGKSSGKSTAITCAAAEKLAKEQGFTVDGQPDKSDNFFVEVTSTVSAGKPLQTTMVLLVDRLTGEDAGGAVIAIDSIDISVLKAEAKK